jgi:hypothetical protein
MQQVQGATTTSSTAGTGAGRAEANAATLVTLLAAKNPADSNGQQPTTG